MQNGNRLFETVKDAFDAFFDQHSKLLDVNANERSITHKLAEALQEAFPNMDVDCEYNRHRRLVKKIPVYQGETITPGDLEAKTVYPDIVVHTRGTDKYNILVIEVKKLTNSQRRCADDAKKLKAFTNDEFHYQVGLYVEIDTTKKSVSKVKCYKEGNEVESTIWDRLKVQ